MRAIATVAVRAATVSAIAAACLSAPRAARADEPIAPGEPRLMSETAEVTSVVDAFDTDDPFDINLLLGFHQSWKSATIRRETAINQPGLSTGGYVAATENIASYSQSTSTLDMGADVGIYKDVALIFRLPLVLADSRSLGEIGSSTSGANAALLNDPTGAPLFKLPFSSPTRSGIDYFSVGLDWAIFNQQRDWTKPTWVIGVTGRFSVGSPLHACNANPAGGVPTCPDPGYLGLSGTAATADPTKLQSRDPGISRGTDAVEFHTTFSRRYGYVEPYTGFKALAEFASYGDMANTNGFQGALLDHPPLVGTFLVGVEVIPWEHREQFQRLVGDLRVTGAYHSAGRDYSELFDALGSSTAPTLRSANPSTYSLQPNGPNAPATSQGDFATPVYFNGITDVQAYGSLNLQGQATWQAGEYIKFVAGLGVTFNQSHLITAADACNPSFTSSANAAGPCHGVSTGGGETQVTGIPNPNHRDVIDLPGQRFSADDTTIVDLFVQGVVMF